jgi:peptide/nickel transport system permease protein
LTDLRRSLTAELSDRNVVLVNQSRWPVLASLTWLDVFFMVWSVTTILHLAWRPLLRFLPTHASRLAAGWSIWLLPPVLVSLAWWAFVPYREDQTAYKQGRLAANVDRASDQVPVVYATVVWPPVPYGLAESVLEKKYLPPPWFPSKRHADGSHEPTPWDTPHWLGTDGLGRDVLSRTLWGGRVSLSVGIVSVSIYVALGILIGALAGFFRGVVDLFISRFIEIVICFPAFFLILTIVALRGPSIWNIMVVIGLTGWTGVARLIRAEFLRLVDQEFVLAGRALGYSPTRLIFRHVLPNALAPVLVSATFGIAGAILTESALSFLGLGITIPIPSWGSLLSDGRNSEGSAPWLIVLPGLAIFITITCYNLVGEALRDASDPRLRGSRS